MIKTGTAYLLDEDIFLRGEIVERDSEKVFVPDAGIQCGFSYQIVSDEDTGTTLFYSEEEIKKAGLGELEVVHSDGETVTIDNISWFFEVSEKANFAKDEDGNPASCYCKFKLGFKKPINEEEAEKAYKEQSEAVKKHVSNILQIPAEYLRIVTEEEYLENTEPEDFDDDECEDE